MPSVPLFNIEVAVTDHVTFVRHDREVPQRKFCKMLTGANTHTITERLEVKVAALLSFHGRFNIADPHRDRGFVRRSNYNCGQDEPVRRDL